MHSAAANAAAAYRPFTNFCIAGSCFSAPHSSRAIGGLLDE
jgi:NaMN:DMB phosphoribosyltransferase